MVPVVATGRFYNKSGASGLVKIIAPFPASDSVDEPYALIALTLA